jgi:hypothetical protein
MRFIASVGLVIISSMFFPLGSGHQLGLMFGMLLVAIGFDMLIQRAGGD